jgi:hypothetical protein
MTQAQPLDNRPLTALIAVAAAGGLAVLAAAATRATTDGIDLLLALLVLGALAERYATRIFKSDVSVGVVAVLAAGAASGLWGAVLVAAPIVLLGQVGTESAWYKRIYNASVYLLAAAAFAAVFEAFDQRATPADWPDVLLPASLAALANFAVNSVLIAGALALSERERLLERWRDNYLWLAPQYLIAGLVATAAASAYAVLGLWGLAVFAAPAFGIRLALSLGARSARALEDERLRPAA